MNKLFLISVFLFLMVFMSHGQDENQVQIKFKINSEKCKLFYTPEEIETIESACEKRMVNIFLENFRFINFTTDKRTHHINIQLIDHDQDISSSSKLGEIGFKIDPINHKDLQPAQPIYWVFRSIEQSQLPLPLETDNFIAEICAVLNQDFNGDKKEDIINNLLSRIELTNEFYFIKDDNSGIVPLNDYDNKIGQMSRLLVLTYVESALGSKRLIDTTLVDRYVENMANARAHYDIPLYYPDHSIVIIQINKETIKAIQQGSAESGAEQKIFMYKHVSATDESSVTESSPF